MSSETTLYSTLVRVNVSDAGLYNDLVRPLVENRYFTKFVRDLIMAYYKSDDVKQSVANFYDENEAAQIDSLMSGLDYASALGEGMRDDISAIRHGADRLRQGIVESRAASSSSPAPESTRVLESRLGSVEDSLHEMSALLRQIVDGAATGRQSAIAPASSANFRGDTSSSFPAEDYFEGGAITSGGTSDISVLERLVSSAQKRF